MSVKKKMCKYTNTNMGILQQFQFGENETVLWTNKTNTMNGYSVSTFHSPNQEKQIWKQGHMYKYVI